MVRWRLAMLWISGFGLVAPPVIGAQEADVLRGRVTDVQQAPIAFARVTATAFPSRAARTVRTDTKGRYTLVFALGDGDYELLFQAVGYAPARLMVRRLADEAVLVGDMVLRPAGLDTVRVVTGRARPARDRRSDEVSADADVASRATDGVGDENAELARAVPGLRFLPGENDDPTGFSALGLGASANRLALEGGSFAGGNLPLDARFTRSVALSAFDVARGGATGVQVTYRVPAGGVNRNHTRTWLADAPALQWMTPAARNWGQASSRGVWSEGGSGALRWPGTFYNIAGQVGRAASPMRTVASVRGPDMLALGVSPDSAQRLGETLRDLGLDVWNIGAPTLRTRDQGTLLAAFDIAPPYSPSGTALRILAYGDYRRTAPSGLARNAWPSTLATATAWSGLVQVRHSAYTSHGVLTETMVQARGSATTDRPLHPAPLGRVVVVSTMADSGTRVADLAFGGSGRGASDAIERVLEGRNSLSWFSLDNRHRVSLTTEVRRTARVLRTAPNAWGTFRYPSIAAVAEGVPGSFSRTLGRTESDVAFFQGALALGDAYRVRPNLQVIAGVRADGFVLGGAPLPHPAVASVFGRRTDALPRALLLSPRVGVAWTVRPDRVMRGADERWVVPASIVRGGVGVFQGDVPASLLGTVLSQSGTANGPRDLSCTGVAVPAAPWGGGGAPTAAPATCAGGVNGVMPSVPAVALFGRGYRPPRSLRGTVSWSAPIWRDRLALSVDATLAYHTRQLDAADLNLQRATSFVLRAEGDRPVLVAARDIDPATGIVNAWAARRTPDVARVLDYRTDGVGTAQQITFGLMPVHAPAGWSWNLAYTYADARRALRGFGATTSGDPWVRTWGRVPWHTRHQIQYGLDFPLGRVLRVSWTGEVSSGMSYTPLVNADINGDGLANDRAFVFDLRATPDSAVRTGMQRLVTTAPALARRCLAAQVGRISAAESCVGAWTHAAWLSATVSAWRLGLPSWVSLSAVLANPLGAADLLLHDARHQRGWGQTPMPDPVLLAVRGFDATTGQFRYTVNAGFGRSLGTTSVLSQPVVLTLRVRMDVGPSAETQLLTRTLARGRTREGVRADVATIEYLVTGSVMNPLTRILDQADALALTPAQADSLASWNRRLIARTDRIWAPVIVSLTALPDRYEPSAVAREYREARQAVIDLLLERADAVHALLTPIQRDRLAPTIANHLNPRYLRAIRAATPGSPYFGRLTW